MGFSRQEYWSGLPFPFPGDLPDSGIELMSPALRANSLQSGLPGKPKVQPTDFQMLSGNILVILESSYIYDTSFYPLK